MNWNKANKLIFDVTCIVAIIIFPLCVLEMIGIERVMRNDY